jgi:hypothetical protein
MSGICLIQSEGRPAEVELAEQPYDSEAILQDLLARHPNLLAGEQMDAANPRHWLLVSREMRVPSEEGGGGRWPMDHLFLDQDATPTFVEVKRSTDTRVRREVIGQMLDYAANAVAHWPAGTMKSKFEDDCKERGTDPVQELLSFLGAPPARREWFWQKAETNLRAGVIKR